MLLDWQGIEKTIADSIGKAVEIQTRIEVGGGCINQAYALQGPNASYFVKVNQAQQVDMFAAEYAGLTELRATQTLLVPQPFCYGVVKDSAFIAMQLLHLGPTAGASMPQLGSELAAMHRVTQPQFGWYRDNTIGSTVQINALCHHWTEFWQQHRLGFQLDLAAKNGYRGKLQQRGEMLLGKISAFMQHAPAASLLHGDLWAGNFAITDSGAPAIFDPAVYYGDRETDLAMTELFGGYTGDFYSAYNNAYPLDTGYSTRKILYNLYHILNHLNLFGGSYLQQSQGMIDRLLSEA